MGLEIEMALEMNAVIQDVCMRLDRDVFLCGYVGMERQDGFHQSFGGYVLGGVPDAKAGRHNEQPNLAAMWMVGVMRAAGVDDYSKAVGKAVRIRLDKEGFGGSIEAIGHIIKDDRWFVPREAFDAASSDKEAA